MDFRFFAIWRGKIFVKCFFIFNGNGVLLAICQGPLEQVLLDFIQNIGYFGRKLIPVDGFLFIRCLIPAADKKRILGDVSGADLHP